MRSLILGILNITEDSFSDGGRYLAPQAALAHARKLSDDGADVLDLGAASCNPDAKHVPPDVEIARLAPIVAALKKEACKSPSTASRPKRSAGRWRKASTISTTFRAFPMPKFIRHWPRRAANWSSCIRCKGVAAPRAWMPPGELSWSASCDFFEARIGALTSAGIARERLILDPGMGFFLGTNPTSRSRCCSGLPRAESRVRPAHPGLGLAQIFPAEADRP